MNSSTAFCYITLGGLCFILNLFSVIHNLVWSHHPDVGHNLHILSIATSQLLVFLGMIKWGMVLEKLKRCDKPYDQQVVEVLLNP